MPESQNYANHKKYVPGFHGIAFVLILFPLVWAIKGLLAAPSIGIAANVAAFLALGFVGFYARTFALQVQDRLIRLEEQPRMASVLPPELKSRIGELRVSNYVALRFASDAELPGLVRRVLNGELTTADSIKQAIKDWRPDHDRA